MCIYMLTPPNDPVGRLHFLMSLLAIRAVVLQSITVYGCHNTKHTNAYTKALV